MKPEFSTRPGCWERHLLRKYHNPLFPAAEREVSSEALYHARSLDAMEQRRFRDAFNDLLQDAGRLSGTVDTEDIFDLKARIERLYEHCASLGGDYQHEKHGLQRLHDTLSRVVRAAAAADPQAVAELDRADAAREAHEKLLEYPIVPDLLREDSPIEEDQLIPSLLSEDEETIRIVMSLFDPEQQHEIRRQAQDLVDTLTEHGENVPAAVDARLAAMYAQPQ